MTTAEGGGPDTPDDSQILRRHFVALATRLYNDPGYGTLEVAGEVSAVRDWLSDKRLGKRAFVATLPALAGDPDIAQVRDAFEDPSNPWNERDAAVLFITGHGEVVNKTHWIALKKSERARLPGTAVRTSDIIQWLARPNGVEHLLLIVDACFAGQIESEVVNLDAGLPRSWLILPSATKNQKATTLVLTTAIGLAVEELRSDVGQRYGVHAPYFLVSDFIDTVRKFLPADQYVQPIYGGPLNAQHLCLPNPHFQPRPTLVPVEAARRDLALPRADLEHHWAPRATGVEESAGLDRTGNRWLFTGRAELVHELVQTIAGERDAEAMVTIVAGGAGSGKSSVLARLVTLSDPTFCQTYADEVESIPADLRPREGHGVDVAIVAREKYSLEILDQLAAAMSEIDGSLAGVGAGSATSFQSASSVDDRIDELQRKLAALARPLCVVLDALDEAVDPPDVVRALSRLCDTGRLRLCIGVRSTGAADDGRDGIDSRNARTLASDVARRLGARELFVDSAPWWDPDDIRLFALSILINTQGSPYADAAERSRAEDLAAALVERIGRNFLVARLASEALARRPDLVEPDDPEWLNTLNDDVVGVFRADLMRTVADLDERSSTIELLRAVAFSSGRGLPWGDIWPTVANAVANRMSKFGDGDIAKLLASPLSAYLILDVEDDVTVYRLLHDSLREALVHHADDLIG